MKTLTRPHRDGISKAKRGAASLPKFLVKRLGKEKVRQLVGLDPEPFNTTHKIRSAKARSVIEWVNKTSAKTFTSRMAARYAGVNAYEAAAVLRGLPNIRIFSSYTDDRGQSHSIVWVKVEAEA